MRQPRAALHVAVHNCEWFEILPFNSEGDHGLDGWNYGLADPVTVDPGGYVHALTAPGLGQAIDWDLINSNVAALAS